MAIAFIKVTETFHIVVIINAVVAIFTRLEAIRRGDFYGLANRFIFIRTVDREPI